MAITEGVGIVAAGKEARAKALAKSKQVTSDKKIAAEYKVDPFDKILRDIDKGFDRIRSQESTGGTKERGRGMGDTFDPSKDFSVKKPSFFSPGGGIYDSRNEVKVASTDLSGLASDEQTTSTFGTSFTDQAGANLADASIYKQKEDSIYRPTDNIYDDLKGIKFPKIEKEKPTTYTDSSGDVYTSKPYTESTPGFKYYGGTDAKLIRKRDDDPKFSQPYSEASNKEAFMKERNAYLKDTGAYSGMISTEKKKPIRGFGDALGAALGLNDRVYTTRTDRFIEASANQDYKEFRKEMRDKVFSESPYGKDVEKKYYYKDFQQPGVYRSEKEVQSYIKDRGAALTGMPSNFQGGVSGIGKKTDDFSKDPRYQSTAGTLAKEKKEPNVLQRVGNFLGDVTNKALGIQTAEASQIGGPLPNVKQSTTTGDTSFASYVRGGETGQERGKTGEWQSRTEFLKKNPGTSMETYLSSLPLGATDFMKPDPNFPGARIVDTDAYERYFMTGKTTDVGGEKKPTSQPTAAPKQTVASLPSNYKQTEAESFRKAAAFKEAQGIAKRNPNVSVGVDSKGQPKATAANDTARARAQAAAVNRKLSGKSISQTKAANRASMKKAAAARNASFQARKKAGKLSKSERTAKGQRAAKKAAAKKRAQAAAKARRARKSKKSKKGKK